MKRIILLGLLGLAFVVGTGCNRKETTPPAQPARVSATHLYEKYFGAAPTAAKGSCFAFVILFPSAKEPGKVVPFPFFSFDEGSLPKLAVERLLGGMEIGSYQGAFLNPFPTGTHVVSIDKTNGTVTLTLSKEFGKAAAGSVEAATQAIALTLRQFQGVSGISILVEGNSTPLPSTADESAIIPPGPPRLLSVVAARDKKSGAVEEVNAFFDRPVNVKELRMSLQDGRALAGDTYLSVFDMAAVLKPRDASLFKAGLPIRVRWDVTDKLGRQAAGDTVWPLEIRDHAE